ncbi:MAG: MFS transporter [Xenococcaceae cyanobacterium]
MSKKKSRLSSIVRAFESRNYQLFFLGQGVSLIGTWMTQTASIWLVYQLTNSALLLGIVGFASQAPSFLLMPFSGVFVDRWNRRRTLVITQVLSMIQSLTLATLTLTNTIEIPHIIALSVFQGMINCFDMPTRQAFVIDLVEKKDNLGNAIALNSSLFSGSRLIGPAIAGLLISLVGAGYCFLIDGISYIAVISSLLAMRIKPRHLKAIQSQDNLWQRFKEGFEYAFGFPPIRAILLLVALVSFMGMPYTVLAPIFATDILKGGPETLGFLMAASGLGAMSAAIYLSSRSTVIGLGKIIAFAPLIFGIGIIIFSLSNTLWLSLLTMLFVGASVTLLSTSSNTILQTIVDEDKRGRVMSFFSMAFLGMVTFGNLLAGTLASTIGAPNTLILGGIACIFGAIGFARQLPRLRIFIRPIYTKIGVISQNKAIVEQKKAI